MEKSMTKKEMINAIFDEENSLTEAQYKYVMSLPRSDIEYAYDVYRLLVIQRSEECDKHFRLIEKLLLGSNQQVIWK